MKPFGAIMVLFFKLVGKEPVEYKHPIHSWEWDEIEELIMDLKRRTITSTDITPKVQVVTLFLVVDPERFGAPLVFQTTIFGIKGASDFEKQYSNWDDAITGHADVVIKVRHSLRRRLRKRKHKVFPLRIMKHIISEQLEQ